MKNTMKLTMVLPRNMHAKMISNWRKKTSEAVVEAIGVRHPLMYDVFNLCEMANENELSSFKCKMLKEICKHFEIPFNTRNSKSELLQKITEMVAECSCSSK